jgi:hypothetical protein
VAWTLQFVDSIASVPTVRLDLNDGSPFGLKIDGTNFGTPAMRYAEASTLMRDGSVFPAAAYGERTLTITLTLAESTRDALATAMQELHRELDRPNNFLKWQQDSATNPVFFRTIRTPPDRWDDFPFTPSPYAEVTVQVLAEPFAYGLKETASTTVSNHPAAGGSTPGYFDVSSVKGDVETPLILRVEAATFNIANDNVSMIAVRRRGTPSSAPWELQAESMTLGTDTTLPGNDAAMSGSSSNYARCSFATTTAMATRLSATFPAAAAVDNRGIYRVLARIRRSVAGTDGATMRLRWGGTSSSVITNDTVTTTVTTNIGYVDLGLVAIPPGEDPVTDGLSGTSLSASGIYLEVQAQRTAGTTNLDVDYLLFFPADDRLCTIRWGTASGADYCFADGTLDKVYNATTAGAVLNANMAQRAGGLPMISPGVTNRIYFIKQIRQGAPVDSVGNTYAVQYSYFPRYLYLRPAST